MLREGRESYFAGGGKDRPCTELLSQNESQAPRPTAQGRTHTRPGQRAPKKVMHDISYGLCTAMHDISYGNASWGSI